MVAIQTLATVQKSDFRVWPGMIFGSVAQRQDQTYSRWKANETTGGGPFKPELPPFPLNRERSPVVRVRPTLLLPHL
jgi:hypothetical protein